MLRIPPLSPQLFLIVLILAVILGIALVYRLKRDIEGTTPTTTEDVLRDLERAYLAGEIEETEFHRIWTSLGGKAIRKKPIDHEI